MKGANQVRSRDESRLLEAMDDELRLLGALRVTLARMDDAVACGDSEAIDDAVYASHRLMQTLAEAQRRRASLVEIGELRARATGRSFAVQEAVARLMECGRTMDMEIRGRCAALERVVRDEAPAALSAGASASGG